MTTLQLLLQVLQFTPLIIAAQEGHVQTVARLIDDKANINRQDEVYYIHIHISISFLLVLR